VLLPYSLGPAALWSCLTILIKPDVQSTAYSVMAAVASFACVVYPVGMTPLQQSTSRDWGYLMFLLMLSALLAMALVLLTWSVDKLQDDVLESMTMVQKERHVFHVGTSAGRYVVSSDVCESASAASPTSTSSTSSSPMHPKGLSLNGAPAVATAHPTVTVQVSPAGTASGGERGVSSRRHSSLLLMVSRQAQPMVEEEYDAANDDVKLTGDAGLPRPTECIAKQNASVGSDVSGSVLHVDGAPGNRNQPLRDGQTRPADPKKLRSPAVVRAIGVSKPYAVRMPLSPLQQAQQDILDAVPGYVWTS